MGPLTNKNIVLGVTGSIAAYKSAEIIRLLRDAGATVRVVMTEAAEAFITPLTLQALSDHEVHRRLLSAESEAAMGHISLGRWANAILIAPASADFLARLSGGLANDLLSTLCLASDVPILVAPAMNRLMWQNSATRDNVAALRRRGIEVLNPDAGSQACGEVGPGRMPEPATLVTELGLLLGPRTLEGLRVVVTAGPTREAIDPVRFLSNRSSGKMGFCVAQATLEAHAETVLITGPVQQAAPPKIKRIDVESTAEMYQAVMETVESCHIFVGVAAVADYRPLDTYSSKLKKSEAQRTLKLEPTEDILGSVAARPHPPFTVGFAAETEDVEHYALEKMRRKALDMIAANRVGQLGLGFETERNALTVYWDRGKVELAPASKLEIARELISLIAERYHA